MKQKTTLLLSLLLLVPIEALVAQDQIILITRRDAQIRPNVEQAVVDIANAIRIESEISNTEFFPDGVSCGNPEGYVSRFNELTANDIPDFDTKVEALIAAWGVGDLAFTDEWLIDLLQRFGYDVRVGDTPGWETLVGTDDQDSAIIRTWEFYDDMSPSEIADLEAAALIIIAPSAAAKFLSLCDGTDPCDARTQWNNITTPIISLRGRAYSWTQFGTPGWGYFYGFPANGFQTLTRFGDFCAPQQDWQPFPLVVSDPAFAGVPQNPTTFKYEIYRDDVSQVPWEGPTPLEDQARLRPEIIQQFSNNPNFSLGSAQQVLAPLPINWTSLRDGSPLSITTRFHYLTRWPADAVAFTPAENGNLNDDWPTDDTVGKIPRGPRVYFSATRNELPMLTEAGEQVLLNLVEEFTGQAPVLTIREPVNDVSTSIMPNGDVMLSFAVLDGATYAIEASGTGAEGSFTEIQTFTASGSTADIPITPNKDREFFLIFRTSD